MSSVAGSPSASWASTVSPWAVRSSRTFSRYARSLFISSDSRSFSWSKLRATQPSATWTSTSSAPVSRARPATWSRIVRSAVEFSMATRMRRYMSLVRLYTNDGLVQQVDVEGGDHDPYRPGREIDPARRDERPHLVRIAGEQNQGKDRKRQLQAQNYLADDDQRPGTALPV